MTIITLKEAQKWFLNNAKNDELQHIRKPFYVIEKFQNEYPNEYVINENEIILDGQKLDVDLNNETLVFYSTKGSYSSYSRTRKCKLTRITLNAKILKCAYDENMKVKIVLPDGQKCILKPNQIPQIKKNRVQIKYGYRLYPIDMAELQSESKDKTSENNKKITDFCLLYS